MGNLAGHAGPETPGMQIADPRFGVCGYRATDFERCAQAAHTALLTLVSRSRYVYQFGADYCSGSLSDRQAGLKPLSQANFRARQVVEKALFHPRPQRDYPKTQVQLLMRANFGHARRFRIGDAAADGEMVGQFLVDRSTHQRLVGPAPVSLRDVECRVDCP